MKTPHFIYIVCVVLVLSSCNQLAVDFPNDSVKNAMLLDSIETTEASLQIIGKFTGKVQARMLFQDSLGKSIPPKSQDMALLDPNTNGAYFRIPEKATTFQIDFWKKRSYFNNTFYLEGIQISNGKQVKYISKDSLLQYFELINIDFNPETGGMLPIKKNPTPQFVYKGKYPNFL